MKRTRVFQVGALISLGAALITNLTPVASKVTFTSLAPPRNVRLEVGDNAIKVMWDASPDEVRDEHAGYTVYFGSKASVLRSRNALRYELQVGKSAHEGVVRGLENGKNYFFHVRSRNMNGDVGTPGRPETAAAPDTKGKNYAVSMYDYDVSATTSNSGYGWIRENGQAIFGRDQNGPSISRLYNVTQRGESVDILMMEMPSAKNKSIFISPSEAAFAKSWPLRNETLIADIGTHWVVADSLPEGRFKTIAEIKEGHIYVLRTHDNYYVKLRIDSIEEVSYLLRHEEKRRNTNLNRITFTYASQFGQSSQHFLHGVPK